MYTLDVLTVNGVTTVAGALLLALLMGCLVLRSSATPPATNRVLVGIALAIPFVLFIYAVGTLSVNVPYWDDYDAILGYLCSPCRMFRLFEFHNEHRIMTVRLVGELVYGLLGRFDFRMMIYVGNLLFLVYVGVVIARVLRQKELSLWWYVPVGWSLLSILMFENMFWALTSVQSNAVLLFALLSLLCMMRFSGKAGYLLAALFFAFMCTFTSGSGVFIWPCLLGMICQRRSHRKERGLDWALVAIMIAACCCLSFYFYGFSRAGEGVALLIRQPLCVAAYFFAFCGAGAHVLPLAVVVGVGVVGFVVWLFLRRSRIDDPAIFFFLCFLLCSAASAAVFRSEGGVGQALGFRYRVVSVSILCCCIILAAKPFMARWQRFSLPLCAAVTVVCVFMNLSAYLLAYPQLVVRRDAHLEGVARWPHDNSGLVHPDTDCAAEILRQCADKGIYRAGR